MSDVKPDKTVGDDDNKGEMVSKADFDALQGKHDKLTKDYEDVRLEVFTEDYVGFLDDKKKVVDDKPPVVKAADKVDVITDEQFEKMSKKEILALATKQARDSIQGELDKVKTDHSNYRKDEISKSVREFASSHEDYETFRPIMFGLSKDPKNASKSLNQLYGMAKDYVKGISGPTKDEKVKQFKLGGETPGMFSDGFKTEKMLSAEAAAAEAANEVIEELGPIPIT